LYRNNECLFNGCRSAAINTYMTTSKKNAANAARRLHGKKTQDFEIEFVYQCAL